MRRSIGKTRIGPNHPRIREPCHPTTWLGMPKRILNDLRANLGYTYSEFTDFHNGCLVEDPPSCGTHD